MDVSPRRTRRLVAALAAVLIVLAAAGLRAADDDFTDIPDFPEGPATPSPGPSTPVVVSPIKPGPPPLALPPVVPVAPKTLIGKIEAERLRAITARVLSVTVCGRSLNAVLVRQSHAFLKRGDDMLAFADAQWLRALKTGDRAAAELSLRSMTLALNDYKTARNPSTLRYTSDDSPPPEPIASASPHEEHTGSPGMGRRRDPVPEPVIWGTWNEIPLE